jgi:hypothetical protein
MQVSSERLGQLGVQCGLPCCQHWHIANGLWLIVLYFHNFASFHTRFHGLLLSVGHHWPACRHGLLSLDVVLCCFASETAVCFFMSTCW